MSSNWCLTALIQDPQPDLGATYASAAAIHVLRVPRPRLQLHLGAQGLPLNAAQIPVSSYLSCLTLLLCFPRKFAQCFATPLVACLGYVKSHVM